MSEYTEIWRAGLDRLIEFKRSQRKMTGWFVAQENKMFVREEMRAAGKDPDAAENQAELLCECVRRLPLSIPRGSVIAGTQDDAFSPSYALINPAFQVETFAGYCDPVAVYNDIEPDDEFPAERIARVRNYFAGTPFVRALNEVYAKGGAAIREVVYFVEPVTGHVIPDFRGIMKDGIAAIPDAAGYGVTIRDSARAAVILANRYADLAERLMTERANDPAEVKRLALIAANCRRVPEHGAQNFQQAVQSYALCWQVMCLEQAPNPYAFSLGNIDRMFAPYAAGCEFADQVVIIRSLLAFLMVGRRCWAISQNVLLGGRDISGRDMTNETTYAVLEAFFESNYPQPALSVRLHRNTPQEFYAALEKFYFTPGHSTPSIFNDDAMFEVLRKKGIAEADIENYAIAGCQEPLITGYENGNTTNSWLNLPKVLELVLNDGRSLLTGEKLGPDWKELGYADADAVYADLENAFFEMLDRQLPRMAESANGCTAALALAPAPFSSLALNCLESGRDMRNAENPGTRYNGSGCLIHGLSVLADSLFAVRSVLATGAASASAIRKALQ
ncbi:MAG: pyruvate formate lyase family protein, partial [Lentisphaeria bacterium]|nr:pyruvate formate lyase family protein [Lentisphaeria bacterium]